MGRLQEAREGVVDFMENVDKATIGVGAGLLALGPLFPPLGVLGAGMIVGSGVSYSISRGQLHKSAV